MACPVCPAAGFVGGYVGGYFGINPPQSTKGRICSALITAGMICISVIALRSMWGISICDGNGNFSLRNMAQVCLLTLFLGVAYSIVVNFVLNRLLFSDAQQPPQPPLQDPPPKDQQAPVAPCCCNGA